MRKEGEGRKEGRKRIEQENKPYRRKDRDTRMREGGEGTKEDRMRNEQDNDEHGEQTATSRNVVSEGAKGDRKRPKDYEERSKEDEV